MKPLTLEQINFLRSLPPSDKRGRPITKEEAVMVKELPRPPLTFPTYAKANAYRRSISADLLIATLLDVEVRDALDAELAREALGMAE